jgi:hypothetical protein
MKVLISFFISLLLIQLAIAQSNSFYDKILDYDKCKDCYFVVIEVESESYTGKVLIENDDLQDFINKTESLDKAKYKEYMKDILLNKKKITVKNAYLKGSFLDVKNVSEHQFRLLSESKEVNEIASKGCIPFVKYYFLGESLSSIDDTKSTDCNEFIRNQNKNLFLSRDEAAFLKEQNTIIDKLFEWEIPTRMDDYSGLLTIRKVDFQKTSDTKK